MTIAILVALLINIVVYTCQIIGWVKDCKEIGKERLAVSLPDRLRAAFLCITLPCIIGLAWRE
jgi:hypothetical protein